MAPPVTSGLVLHLDATTLALAENDPVSTWADQSGLGRDATQATSSKQPRYHADVGDGRPGVEFDGSADCLVCATAQFVSSTDGTWTVFAVAYPLRANSTNNDTLLASDTGSSPRVAQFLRATATAQAQSIAFNTGGTAYTDSTGSNTLALHDRSIFEGVRTATTVETLLNGVSNGTAATAGTPQNGAQSLTVGARHPTSAFFAGWLHEVLVYNRALTSTERDDVRDYLAARWPTLAGTLPFADAFTRSLYTYSGGNLWQPAGPANFALSGNAIVATAPASGTQRFHWGSNGTGVTSWAAPARFSTDVWFNSSAAGNAEIGLRVNNSSENWIAKVVQDGAGACEVRLVVSGVTQGTYAVAPPTSGAPLNLGVAVVADASDPTDFTYYVLVNGSVAITYLHAGAATVATVAPFLGISAGADATFDNAAIEFYDGSLPGGWHLAEVRF